MIVHVLIAFVYIAAGAAVAVLLDRSVAADPDLAAWLAGGGVMVVAGLGHLIALHIGHRSQIAGRLRALETRQHETLGQIESARRRMAEFLADLEPLRSRSVARLDELRELRSLVGQLSRKLESPALPAPVRSASISHLPVGAARHAVAGAAGGAATAVAVARAPMVGVPPAAPDPVVDLPPAKTFPNATEEEIQTVERIREAVQRRRVDMFVQPVVRLPQRHQAFYEAYSRLRARDGTHILPETYLPIAEQAGLITAIDNILLFRCVEQIRRDLRRDVSARYFCNLSWRTLADETFFPQFAAYLEANRRLAAHLILELSQSELSELEDAVARRLGRLTAAGFSLAMDEVTELDLDVPVLAARHFSYVKIEAAALLPEIGGEPAIDVEALQERLHAAGITLIVEKIEGEDMLLDLLDYNVDYGQGYLFGEPRKSR
ncbi:MAG: EAL domain-containing protein [Alphaproteobacteria bacterium]|nr:EAL domain-containing protein [Alphaproteobacteria bacterium]MDP6517343.1 EAL domain-containing protein [Alphaproteobacteria bacterium]